MNAGAKKSAERLEKKLQSQLRACQKEPGNKRCADCTERLPQYIITDFNTFVCTACSGIHREFSHRVKSISLATFSEEEVAAVKAGGNEANNKLYMAKYRPGHDLPEPEGGRAEKHREFIRTKYVDKRWYATPEDLEAEKRREAEREEAKAKREAERASNGSGSGSKKQELAGGSVSGRPRRGTVDRGLRKVVPVAPAPASASASSPAAKAKANAPVAAPAKQVDLLDFLSDDPAPTPAQPPTPPQPAAAQPWDAFGSSGGGGLAAGGAAAPAANAAAAPPPASGFASWAAFGEAPAAPPAAPAPLQPHQQQPAGVPPQQTPPAAATMTGFRAAFPANPFSSGFPPPPPPGGGGGGVAQMQQPQQQQQQPWGGVGASNIPQQQQQQPQQQQQQQQHPTQRSQAVASPDFGSQAAAGGLLSPAAGMGRVAAVSAPNPAQSGWQNHGHQQQQQHQPLPQQGFLQPAGGFPAAGTMGSAPGTPSQQQQQQKVGGFSPAHQGAEGGGTPVAGSDGAGGFATGFANGFAGSFEAMSISSPTSAVGGSAQQPPGFTGAQQGQGRVNSQQQQQQQPVGQQQYQQGAPQMQQYPQQFPQQQQQQQQPHQQQYPQQQHPQQQYPRQQQQHPQQQMQVQMQQGGPAAAGPARPQLTPLATADVDPFAELAAEGTNNSDRRGPRGEQRFEKGDEVLYVRGSDPPLDGVIQKVHLEDETPYYTVFINVTGREKNTDHLHLRHKGAKGATNGHQPQYGRAQAGPDAFAELGAVASWGTPSTGAAGAPFGVPASALQNAGGPQQQQQPPQQQPPNKHQQQQPPHHHHHHHQQQQQLPQQQPLQQQQQQQQQQQAQQQQQQQQPPPQPVPQAQPQVGPPVPPKPSKGFQSLGQQGPGAPPSIPMPPVPDQQAQMEGNPFGGMSVAPEAAVRSEQGAGGNPFDMF